MHARPRATGDIDLWVEATAVNSERVYRALAAFGARVDAVDERTFADEDVVFQIGAPPRRIDVLTGIDGISFADARPARVPSSIGSAPVNVLGRDALLVNKRASGRPKDLADIARLTAESRPHGVVPKTASTNPS